MTRSRELHSSRDAARADRNVRRALDVAVKAAGIVVAPDERLSAHALRHTFTSHLIVRMKLDPATTSKLAGHADPAVTMRV